ncbi:MAG: helicase-related protein [Thermoplasmata archaeon]
MRSEGRWKLVPKDRVENLVQAGSLRILMATDAASEGLNLQAMDSVINYDLPWNPMRIEQRIGRIDRVTQESPIIRIGALVPEETIEMEVYGRCLDRLDLFKQSVGPMQPVLVESFVRDIVLKGEDMEKRWDAVEREWNAAKEHARLLEEALSAQSLETGWLERKAAETRALGHLLDALGYRREGNVWVRGGHRVAVESSGKGISRITAIPHDPVFLSLLPELGPPPEFLSWSGLEYRILDAGGSRILAVRHRDGGIHIVRDISDIRADDSVQVGRNWEDARHYAMRLEKDRERSYERFMERQQEVRRKGWRRKVRTEVLQPLVRWAAGNVEKAAQQVVSDETLAKLCRRYLGATEGLASGNVKALLSKVAEKSGGRGRPPFLENIVRRARELAEGEGMR